MVGKCTTIFHSKESKEYKAILILAILCTIDIWWTFFRLVIKEKQRGIYLPKVQILSLRTAIVVPVFCSLNFIAFFATKGLFILEAAEALTEGYIFYCLFKIILFYVNSKQQIIKSIEEFGKSSYIGCFESRHPGTVFSSINIAIAQFLFVRPVFVLIGNVVQYRNGSMKVVTAFTVLELLSLLYALVSLLRLMYSTSKQTNSINVFSKFLYVKLVVFGLIVQNVIHNKICDNKGGKHTTSFAFQIIIELDFASKFVHYLFLSNLDKSNLSTLDQSGIELKNQIDKENNFQFILRVLNLFIFIFDDIPDNYQAVSTSNKEEDKISNDIEVIKF